MSLQNKGEPLQNINKNAQENAETDMHTSYKQIIVIIKSLGMKKGKLVSQGAHASMGAVIKNMCKVDGGYFIPSNEALDAWFSGSFTKIVTSVQTQEELEILEAKAKEKGLLFAKITDNGRTAFNGVKTVTALAIGPAHENDLDFTSELPLF